MINSERRKPRPSEAATALYDGIAPRENAPHGRRQAHAGVADRAAPPRRAGGYLLRTLNLFLLWQERSHQRRQLAGLDDDGLKDIAVSRIDAEREARKWFWQE